MGFFTPFLNLGLGRGFRTGLERGFRTGFRFGATFPTPQESQVRTSSTSGARSPVLFGRSVCTQELGCFFTAQGSSEQTLHRSKSHTRQEFHTLFTTRGLETGFFFVFFGAIVEFLVSFLRI